MALIAICHSFALHSMSLIDVLFASENIHFFDANSHAIIAVTFHKYEHDLLTGSVECPAVVDVSWVELATENSTGNHC